MLSKVNSTFLDPVTVWWLISNKKIHHSWLLFNLPIQFSHTCPSTKRRLCKCSMWRRVWCHTSFMQCDASVLFMFWLRIDWWSATDSIECGSFRDCEQQSHGRVSPPLFTSLFHAAFSAYKTIGEAQFATRRFLLLQNKVTFCRAELHSLLQPRSSLLGPKKMDWSKRLHRIQRMKRRCWYFYSSFYCAPLQIKTHYSLGNCKKNQYI